MKKLLLLLAVFCFWASTGQANDTILRITCQPQDQGAKIYVNGSYKGDCSADSSLDVFTRAGRTTVKAVKMPDANHEQIFEEQLTLVAGVPKRFSIVLPEPQLTQAARQAMEKEKFRAALQKAKNGDTDAMETVAGYYASGYGVASNSTEAWSWRQKREETLAAQDLKAAKAGNFEAMAKMADRYQNGKGVERNSKKAKKWSETRVKMMDEAHKRKVARKRKKVAERRKKEMEEELKTHETFYLVKNVNPFLNPRPDPMKNLIAMTSFPIASPLLTIMDITTLPTALIKQSNIKKKYEAHAGAWAKPNSMLAKAYRQQSADTKQHTSLLYAAR